MDHRERKLQLSLEEAIVVLLPPAGHPKDIVAQMAEEYGKKRTNWGTMAVLAARLVVDKHPERPDHASLYHGIIILKLPVEIEIQLGTILSTLRGMGEHGKCLHNHLSNASRYWQLHPDHTPVSYTHLTLPTNREV